MSAGFWIFAAILTAALLVWRYPEKTERAWNIITTLTGGFWAIVVFLAAFVLISTGVTAYVILGFLILVLATLTLIFKRPDQDIIEYARGVV